VRNANAVISRQSAGWRIAGALVGVICVLLVLPITGYAVRVLPSSLNLEQEPGTTETHLLTIVNDTEDAEELQLYVGDWQRRENGEHDYDIPLNSARWIFDRPFNAGETVEIRYTAQLAETFAVDVEGTFRSFAPQVSGSVQGASLISEEAVGTALRASEIPAIWIGRTLEEISTEGIATILLSIQCNVTFHGLVIYETYNERLELGSLDDGGARFDTVNRSNAGWIALSHERLVLAPDESREVVVTIEMPAQVDGTYWSAVFVEAQPQVEEQNGTRVLSIYRTAIKVYTTALGSSVLNGQVVDVQVAETAPLVLYALFENTGNAELVVTGETQIIDRFGEKVRDFLMEDFKILPGAKRIVVVQDAERAEPLTPDIYQAIVSFEYGGENPVVGVRGFRVR